ncbi:MAG: hypothetical protein R3D46_10120 [Defluviimonas denitrificans]
MSEAPWSASEDVLNDLHRLWGVRAKAEQALKEALSAPQDGTRTLSATDEARRALAAIDRELGSKLHELLNVADCKFGERAVKADEPVLVLVGARGSAARRGRARLSVIHQAQMTSEPLAYAVRSLRNLVTLRHIAEEMDNATYQIGFAARSTAAKCRIDLADDLSGVEPVRPARQHRGGDRCHARQFLCLLTR